MSDEPGSRVSLVMEDMMQIEIFVHSDDTVSVQAGTHRTEPLTVSGPDYGPGASKASRWAKALADGIASIGGVAVVWYLD